MRCKGVYLGRIGEFNGGRVKITDEILSGMERASFPTGTHRPRHHIGHPEPMFTGEQPAIGYYERLYRDGNYLRGDLAGVEPWDARQICEQGPFPERSMELARSGDGYEVLACGSLGSSAPGIPGMPPIAPDQWEWMDDGAALNSTEEVLYLSAAGREVIRLQADAEPHTPESEETMSENIQAQLDALEQKLGQKYEAALAASNEKIEELTEKLSGTEDKLRQVETVSLARARANELSLSLQNGRKVTPGEVKEGKLDAVLLHAAQSCPPIEIEGKSVPYIDALSALFNARPTFAPARNFSVAPERTALSNDKTDDEVALSAARTYAEENKCTLQQAIQALARKEATNVA